MLKSGIYINLDRSIDRKNSLIKSLNSSGLDSHNYERISGIEPTSFEKEKSRGLKKLGEAGIWKSFIFSLEYISRNPSFEPFIHFLEDDSEMSPSIKRGIEISKYYMINNPKTDLIFLDYFINPPLAYELINLRKNYKKDFLFHNASKFYMACMASFIIRKSSAYYILGILKRIFNSACPLTPIDITLRQLLRLGIINGSIIEPSHSSPKFNPPLSEKSTIQTNVDQSMHRSLEAHILLRKLISGQFSVYYCGECLSKLFEIDNPLNKSSSTEDFLFFFTSCQKKYMQKF